jgi:hypothetical protein
MEDAKQPKIRPIDLLDILKQDRQRETGSLALNGTVSVVENNAADTQPVNEIPEFTD